ncbi:MAG: LON peptidase substrate-binding domain-containing protein, partial [Aggregatilineales bacterium]
MFGNYDSDINELLVDLPDTLPVLPLRNVVPFPSSMLPILVGTENSLALTKDTLKGNRLVMLVNTHDPDAKNPNSDEVYTTGTVAMIQRATRGQKGTMQLFIQTLERARITEWTQELPYLMARVELAPEDEEINAESEALHRGLMDISREIVALMPSVPDNIVNALEQLESNLLLTYTIAANSRIDDNKRLEILELDSVNEKMRVLLAALMREKDVLEIGQKIQSDAQEEINKQQREYILRKQMSSIRKELGEDEDGTDADNFREKIAAATMSEEAEKEALKELRRLERLSPQSAEYGVIRSYLDWLVELPWQSRSEDNLDIAHARAVLDDDHYDLKDVKDRILEYLAVRKLASERGGDVTAADTAPTILLFVGPPGVGKTSLGKSIARALGREFSRLSLGGMRDESEIRGHRRTYIGAMPGRIVQSLKRAGTRNPLMMLDEIDKVGTDWRGDPASAL